MSKKAKTAFAVLVLIAAILAGLAGFAIAYTLAMVELTAFGVPYEAACSAACFIAAALIVAIVAAGLSVIVD